MVCDCYRYGHFVVITGWNFTSTDPKDHYWIVKDSLSGLGIGQYWKVSRQQLLQPVITP